MDTTKSVIPITPQNEFIITPSGISFFIGEDLSSHASAEGHAKLLEQVKILQKELKAIDKKFDIHLQDYVNYKDASLLALNGNDEKIDHKWERTENLFKEQKIEIKDLQKFLQKEQNFRIRE
ncbi:MAG: hypothetical protein V7K32_05025 [Nostoc sp.]|uniref:hypothetical protein n=1 Tax=Nostoc sp. TaxID=1180 RepID=UPI002FF555DD